MKIFVDGPTANPENNHPSCMNCEADKHALYSDAYPSKLLLDGAVKQIKVREIAVGGDDFVLAAANPSAEDEEEDFTSEVVYKLALLENHSNLQDVTDFYDKKQAEKDCKAWFKKVLFPYIKKQTEAGHSKDDLKDISKKAQTFIQNVFGKKDKENPSKSIASKYNDCKAVRNESFGEDGEFNSAWMFVFDEDQDTDASNKEAWDARIKYVWVFPYGQEEVKY